MVLRLLSLALLLGATSIAAQVPARAPTRAATAAPDTSVGWFGFRQLLVGDTLTVLEVAPGSPAQRAGLRPGDWIMAIDGRAVHERYLNAWPAAVGDVRKVTVRRGGETLTLSMVAVAPPSGVLMPTRAAVANADTIASEARQLRGQMALRATRAAAMQPTKIADTVGGMRVAWSVPESRSLRDTLAVQDLIRGDPAARRILEAYIEGAKTRRASQRWTPADSAAILNDTLLYNELRSVIEARDSGRTGLSDQQLYRQLQGEFREQNATVARLTRAPNAISGAEFEELNPGLAEYFYGVSEGVFVLRVAANSPSSAGGLRPGDIIQSVNGQEIRTVAELRAAIAASGRTTNLGILRKGISSRLILEYFGSATRRPPAVER